MAKLKGPLSSLNASGTISRCITFLKRRKQNIAEKKPIPKDAQTSKQLAWRTMYQLCVDLWHTLSAAEKLAWESSARPRHMTGYAWYLSQCLRPNPGIYLPLLGGTMQGAIEMADFHIHGLPAPVHLQDPLRRQDYVDYIQPFLHAQGAKVSHTAHQAIPHATATELAFNREIYDTNAIHDNVVNNSRLTCKTAGKYTVKADIYWLSNNAGLRDIHFRLNGVATRGSMRNNPIPGNDMWQILTMNLDLAVSDFVELRVTQTSGGALDVRSIDDRSPLFMMQRIGT